VDNGRSWPMHEITRLAEAINVPTIMIAGTKVAA
jgi:hypothetical protein